MTHTIKSCFWLTLATLFVATTNTACSRRVEKRAGSLGITVNLPPIPPEYSTGNWLTNLFASTPEPAAVAIALKVTGEAGNVVVVQNLHLDAPYVELELAPGNYTAEAEVLAAAVVGGASALCTLPDANKPQLAATVKQNFKVDSTTGEVALNFATFEPLTKKQTAFIKLSGDISHIVGYTFLHSLSQKPVLNSCS